MTLFGSYSHHRWAWRRRAAVADTGAVSGRFVVQHHLARADHYDFRLEIGGVLASWAVPKGPSADPQVRRMAIRTDDHEVDHESVEGAFGRSIVLVWDRGTYDVISREGGVLLDGAAALARGRLSFRLHGEKLRGGWTLIRLPDRQRETWLLIKKADADADATYDPVRTAPESVLTGRTLDEIASEDQPGP